MSMLKKNQYPHTPASTSPAPLPSTRVLAALSFLIPLALFIRTTARTIISYADSSELATVAYTFEAAHPPGYPLFVILGKIFTLIPIGTIAFRVNLFACFLGALTVFFLFQILKKVGFSPLSAFLGSQAIAYSYSFWLYSITSEVFVLNNAIAALLICLVLAWRQKRLSKTRDNKSAKLLYLLAFAFGLGLSNHTTIVLIAPAIAFIIWVTDKKMFLQNFFRLLLFFLLGLTPYFHLAIAARLPHYPNFGNIPGLKRFYLYISRVDYGGLLSGGTPSNIVPSHYWGLFLYYLRIFSTRYTPLAPILSLYLAFIGIKKGKIIPLFFSIIVLTTGIFFPIYAFKGIDASDNHALGVVERFGQLGFLSLGISAVISLYRLTNARTNPNREKLFQALMLTFTLFLLVSNFKDVDKSDYFLAKNYALNILNQVEPNSIILSSDDITTFSLFYFVNAENLKPDIRVIYASSLKSIWYQMELNKMWPDLYQTDSNYEYEIIRSIIETNQNKRPVYFVMLKDPYPFGFDANPNYLNPSGLVLKADLSATKESVKASSSRNYWKTYDLSGLQKQYRDPFAQLTLANYPFRYKVNAKAYLSAGCLKCAQTELSQGLSLFPNHQDLEQTRQSLQLPSPSPKKVSAADYLKSAQNFIQSTAFLYELNYHRAIWDLEQAKKIDPENEAVRGLLGQVYDYLGVFDRAIEEYSQAAGLNPQADWKNKAEEVLKRAPKEVIQ